MSFVAPDWGRLVCERIAVSPPSDPPVAEDTRAIPAGSALTRDEADGADEAHERDRAKEVDHDLRRRGGGLVWVVRLRHHGFSESFDRWAVIGSGLGAGIGGLG